MRDNRSCTCHPDEAPKPCQRHFGLSECFMAAEIERLRAALREIDKQLGSADGRKGLARTCPFHVGDSPRRTGGPHMSDEMDAMMADGLLHTVRECAHRLYGENNIYPCDDVKRMTDEIERFKLSLADVVMQTQEQAQEIKKLRADYETARDAHDRRMAEVVRLRAALRDVMVGGNHLATVLGIGHLASGSSHEAALDFYGPGPNYDVWCCWNAIMQARAALEERT